MFSNRQEAGRLLASFVADSLPLVKHPETEQFVIGIGRGGILVAGSVARALRSPLSAFQAEPILDPDDCAREICAVSSSGLIVYDENRRCQQGEQSYLGQQVRDLCRKARESEKMLLNQAGLEIQPVLAGKRVVAVDDGINSDLIREATAASIARLGASQLVLAVPAISKSSKDRLERSYHTVLSLIMPVELNYSIGDLYDEFQDVEDAELIQILRDTIGLAH